jgi:hypothetical protein
LERLFETLFEGFEKHPVIGAVGERDV